MARATGIIALVILLIGAAYWSGAGVMASSIAIALGLFYMVGLIVTDRWDCWRLLTDG